MPKKYNQYFTHDSNAKDDPKCVMLIEQLGMEGYGIYWMLVETLRDQPNYRYPINLLSALARRYNTTHEKIKAVVCSYNLFVVDGEEFFFSRSLIDRMEPLEAKRLLAQKAGKASAKKRKLKEEISTDVQRTFNVCSTTVQPVKKSKEEYSKSTKVDIIVPKKTLFSLSERQSIFMEELKPYVEQYGREMIRAFYDYWTEPNQAGKKMRKELEKTWKTDSRLRTWERRSNGK